MISSELRLALGRGVAPRGDAVPAQDAADGLRVRRLDRGDVQPQLEPGRRQGTHTTVLVEGLLFGDTVVWVPWRRPGFQLGLDIAAIKEENPQAIGCILGGHGITAWGDTSRRGRGAVAGDRADRRGVHRRRLAAGRTRSVRWSTRALADDGAARPGGRAGAGDPRAGLDGPAAGRPLHRLRRGAGLPVPRGARGWPSWARPARTTSCAPRSSRWWWTCPPTRPLEDVVGRLKELHAAVPGGLPGLLRPQRDRRTARRSAAPTRRSCWSRAWGCSRSARTSRPPGWRGSSTSTRST